MIQQGRIDGDHQTMGNNQSSNASVAEVGGGSADRLPDYTAQPSSALTPQEKALLTDPSLLVGETLLQLAANHATSDIAQHANDLAGKQVVTTDALRARIANALLVRAAQSGRRVNEVRGEWTDIRKKNGVLGRERMGSEQKAANGVKRAVGEVEKQNTGFARNDLKLLANPDALWGEQLIELAERYSHRDIAASLPINPKTQVPILTVSGVNWRLRKSLQARATATSRSFDEVRDEFTKARKANGVRTWDVRTRTSSRIALGDQGAAMTAKGSSSRKFAGDAGSELMDGGGEMEQDYSKKVKNLVGAGNSSGPSASEVYAADALLVLSDDPEVIEAANILLTMVSDDRASVMQDSEEITMGDADTEA